MTDLDTTEATETYSYNVTVEDAGQGGKRVTVVIPADKIKEELDKQFADLKGAASLPGFRPGKAPTALLQKRFGGELKKQVRDSLVRESYQQAIEKNSLTVLGEPEFGTQEIELPESGDLTYSFEVDLQPEFTLPDFSNLTVKKPKIEVNDEHVQQALKNLSEQQGTLKSVDDRGIEEGDYLLADIHVKLGEEVLTHQHDAQIVARPGRIAGVQIDDLPAKLSGLKIDETRTFDVAVPDSNPNEKIKGQTVQVEIKLKSIRKLEPADINQDFLTELGFENHDELNAALREEMIKRIDSDVANVMYSQVRRFLIENTQMDLPAKLSSRQEERVVNQRAMNLLQRGAKIEDVRANVEAFKAGADDEAKQQLKVFFVLSKIAGDRSIEVTEGELNGQLAQIAFQRDQRPDKVRGEMQKNGQLQELYMSIRDRKVMDAIIAEAKVEEVDAKDGPVDDEGKQVQAVPTQEVSDAT